MKRRSKHGIFLVSVLFVVLLITMFVGAAFQLAPWAFRRTGNQADGAAAQQAARSGIEYALARIQANPLWRAEGPRRTVVDDGTLTVVEEQGNVVGLLKLEGQVSQFRLRFNYQDGTGGADALPNPAALSIDSPWVSFNNMGSSAQADVPRADGPGGAVRATPTVRTTLPGHAVYLVVEGRAGDWLGTASASNPNPRPGFGTVSAVQVETTYKLGNSSSTPASVLSAAGDISAKLPSGNHNLKLDSADRSSMPRIRSHGNLSVQGGDTPNLTAARQAEIALLAGGSFTGSRSASVGSTTEAPGQDFYNLKWSQVRQADGSNVLPAGVYTVDQLGQLHYYPMSMADYRTLMSTNPGAPGVAPTLPPSVSYNHSSGSNVKATFTVTGDTLVQAAGAVQDVAIVPKSGVDAGPEAADVPEASAWSAAFAAPSNYNSGDDRYHYDGAVSTLLQQMHQANMLDWGDLSGIHIEHLEGGGNVEFKDRPGLLGGIAMMVGLTTEQSVMRPGLQQIGGRILSYISTHPDDPSIGPAMTSLGLTAGGLSTIPGVNDTVRASDITVKFAPAGSSAVLSTPGNVTLGARLEGEGGSLASAGSINLVGLGVDFSATDNPNQGVSLYSKGDVLIDTYDANAQRYRNVALKGVVYTWGNLRTLLGSSSLAASKWAQFNLTGALIAYGKDPDAAGPATAGKVSLTAKDINLKFDPSYLNSLGGSLPSQVKLVRSTWEQH